jgi:hypothetical protein
MHCSAAQCGWAGDPIQLAARTWRVSIQSAVARLQQLRIPVATDPESVSQYVASLAYRKQALDFWQQARQRSVHHSNAASRLVHELGWGDELSPSRRKEGPARLFGWAKRNAVERLFMPNAAGKTAHDVTSADRVFVGRNWGDDVLIVPYWQLPYQLAGFMFIGRDGDPAKDFVFRRLRLRVGRAPFAEAGLAMHTHVPRRTAGEDRRVLMMTDLAAAVGWQVRNLVRSPTPLPLAVWHRGRDPNYKLDVTTRHAWQWFHDRKLVFWMPTPDAGSLVQAARLGAEIVSDGPVHMSYADYLRRHSTPSAACRRLLDLARPWRTVFAELLETLPDHEALDLLLQFQADDFDLGDVLSRCPVRIRQRADRLLPPAHSMRTVAHKGDEVYEEDCCWYRHRRPGQPKRRPELICNALIRVNEIVTFARSREAYYRGEVLFKHAAFPFCVDRKTIEGGTWRWLRDFLIEQQAGVLQYDPTYGDLLTLAARFHPPAVREESFSVGWRSETSELALPQFSLRNGGEATVRKMLPVHAKMPGVCLNPPAGCSPVEIDDLTADRQGSPTLWAVVAATLSNILGPIFHEPRVAVGLCGQGATWTGALVAEAFGCRRFAIGSKPELRTAAQQSLEHRWPAYFDVSESLVRRSIHEWLRQREHNCLVNLSDWNAMVCQAEGCWLTVWSERGWNGDKLLIDSLRLFLTAYLQDLFERRLDLQAPANASLCQQLLCDLSAYASALSPTGARILEGAKLLGGDSPAARAEAFGALLSRMCDERRLHMRRVGFDDFLPVNKRETRLYYDDDQLFVARETIEQVLRDVGAVPLRNLQLTQTLAAAGILRQERPEGWSLSRDWWDAHRRRRRGDYSSQAAAD